MSHKLSKITLGIVAVLAVLIPLQDLQAAAEESEATGYLGVYLEELTRLDKRQLDSAFGVLVTRVVKDGPADQAGILEDDVIQYYNGQPVKSPADLTGLVRKTGPDTVVTLRLKRLGKTKTLRVTIGQRESGALHFPKGQHFSIFPDSKGAVIAPRSYLGVQIHSMDDALKEYFHPEGALVLKVEPDSPAEKAGMKSGDVITGINQEEISGVKDLPGVLFDFQPGEEVTVTVIRHGKKKKLPVVLGESSGFFRWNFHKGKAPLLEIEPLRHHLKQVRERIKNHRVRIDEHRIPSGILI